MRSSSPAQGRSCWVRETFPIASGMPGSTPGRFLLIISPAGLEPFFEEFSRVMATSPHDLALQAEVAGRYGIEFV